MAPFTVKKRPINAPPRPLASPTTLSLPKGHQRFPDARPLPCEIILDRDAVLSLRDGTKIRADIYRPATSSKVPAIMMWGPYGKSGSGLLNISVMPLRAGIPLSKLSGYENFEGPDPAEWVPRGYALVNVDPRGIGDSEGDARFWGSGEGQDGADAVDQISKLDWCNGNVGMAGNSWLGMAQWYIAAEKPSGLKCIAPLEGISDPIREDIFRGGVEQFNFMETIAGGIFGRQMQEHVAATFTESNVSNEYWEDKRAKVENIDVPAYILGSYSSRLHTVGSLRGFEEIRHDKKWLTIHATQEWYDLYTDERTSDLQKFFDFYLKGINNGWESTPPMRMTFLRFNKSALTGQPYVDLPWKLPCAKKNKLYLHPNKTLSSDLPSVGSGSKLSYQADSSTSTLDFTHTFSAKTNLAGPSHLTLHLSAPSATDLDVYVQIRKASATGELLRNVNIPFSDLGFASESLVPHNNVTVYPGPEGILRASRRHVSEEMSTPWWKTLSNAKIEPVKQGEVVELQIGVWPSGIVFEEGEKLVVRVSGHPLEWFDMGTVKDPFVNRNTGEHVLHFDSNGLNYLEFWEVPLPDQ